MAQRPKLRTMMRTGTALGLSAILISQPLAASAVNTPPQLAGEARVVHALNRLTFGPRPGDVAKVEKMGLERWFDQQLDPTSIDDSALDARLAEWPAASLPLPQLQARYAGPLQIRQMIAGKLDLPSDPQARLLAQDQIALYKLTKQKQEAAAPGQGGMEAAEVTSVPAPHELLDKLVGFAPDARLAAILALSPEQMLQLRKAARGGHAAELTTGMTPQQKETVAALGGSNRMIAQEAMESRLTRDIYSNRQLEAVMTDFWLNHFNIYVKKNQNEAFLLPSYERETIRPHALGNFEELLDAVATSPAMLEYLDNFRSIGPDSQAAQRAQLREAMDPGEKAKGSSGLNENYGRELMELHTLGVNGGYTQADVTNVAKVFTGWTLERPSQPGRGGFVFNERQHEPGSKTVLGKTIKEDGMKEGLEVLHLLATSPATAHFVSEKLAVRFVNDAPPDALVDRMAQSFLASHGDIRTVLRTMFHSPEFWAVETENAKVKTPEEFVVSAVRASGSEVTNPAALVASLDRLGMPLYGMQTPNGYSWRKEDWVSTGALVSRMNFALVLADGRIPGVVPAWDRLLASAQGGMVPAAYASENLLAVKERRLEASLMALPVSVKTRAAILAQAENSSAVDQAETDFDLVGAGRRQQVTRQGQAPSEDPQAAVIAGLLLGSPEFQRR